MKRCLVLAVIVLLLLSSCSSYREDATPEDIVAAYEAAGYSVWSEYYDEKLEDGQIGYIQANHPDGDYIYFSIFETEEEAKAFKEEFYHPVTMGLFSAIFGDPSWQRWEVYENIVIQYDEPEFYEVFLDLVRGKCILDKKPDFC